MSCTSPSPILSAQPVTHMVLTRCTWDTTVCVLPGQKLRGLEVSPSLPTWAPGWSHWSSLNDGLHGLPAPLPSHPLLTRVRSPMKSQIALSDLCFYKLRFKTGHASLSQSLEVLTFRWLALAEGQRCDWPGDLPGARSPDRGVPAASGCRLSPHHHKDTEESELHYITHVQHRPWE